MSNTRRTPRDRSQPPPVSVQAETSSSPPHADEVANAAPATPPPPQAAPGPAPPTPPTLAPRAPPSPPSSASAKPAPSARSGGRPAETGLPRDTGNVPQADLASVLQAIHAGNQLMLVQFNEARMMEFAAAREQAEQFQHALSSWHVQSLADLSRLARSQFCPADRPHAAEFVRRYYCPERDSHLDSDRSAITCKRSNTGHVEISSYSSSS